MIRRLIPGAVATVLLVVAFGAASQTSGPIKLARHPDYHAGTIAFSYLGAGRVRGQHAVRLRHLDRERGRHRPAASGAANAQIEKAVEVLKAELATKKTTSQP